MASDTVSMEELGKVTDNLSLEVGSAKELASNYTLNSLTDLTDNSGELSSISCSGALDVLYRDVHF